MPLRPLTVPDILDGSFEIVRRRPRDVLTLAAIFVLPLQALAGIVVAATGEQLDLFGFGDVTAILTFDESGDFVFSDAAAIAFGLSAVSLVFLAAALSIMLDAWLDGVDLRPVEVVRRVLRRSPALLGTVVLVHLLEAVGIVALGVGAYLAMCLCHVAAPAAATPGVGPVRAVRRSFRLTRQRWLPTFGLPALVFVVSSALGFGLQAIPELATLVVPDAWDWVVRSAGQVVLGMLTLPFAAGVAVVYHVDLAIRVDGLDLRRRIDDLAGVEPGRFGAVEPGRSGAVEPGRPVL